MLALGALECDPGVVRERGHDPHVPLAVATRMRVLKVDQADLLARPRDRDREGRSGLSGPGHVVRVACDVVYTDYAPLAPGAPAHAGLRRVRPGHPFRGT